MPRLRRFARLSLLPLALSAGLASSASALGFSEVYFFGDSLTDTGRNCTGLAPAEGYDADRCSNGPIWADVLVSGLGVSADSLSSASGGPNYANGGADAGDLAGQISEFDADNAMIDGGALYTIWMGANDVLSLPGGASAMQNAVDDIVAGIDSLSVLGADSFLVANLPNFGRAFGPNNATPWTDGQRDSLEALSFQFNALLTDALAGIGGVEIFSLDVYSLFEDIVADPVAFGFDPSNFSMDGTGRLYFDPCRNDTACDADPMGAIADGFVLFDWVHPTSAAHAWIGAEALAAVPEPGTALLLGVGLAALGTRRRNARG